MQKYTVTGWYGYGVCLDPYIESTGDPESIEAYFASEVDARIAELEQDVARYENGRKILVADNKRKDERIAELEKELRFYAEAGDFYLWDKDGQYHDDGNEVAKRALMVSQSRG